MIEFCGNCKVGAETHEIYPGTCPFYEKATDRHCANHKLLPYRPDEPSIDVLRKRYAHLVGDVCERCGTTENLGLHHKDGNPANNDPSNLMTLCNSCHTKWHWENGKKPHKEKSVCAVCGNPGKGLGLCLKHYQRQKKYGSPYLTKKKYGSLFLLMDERYGPPAPANNTTGNRRGLQQA